MKLTRRAFGGLLAAVGLGGPVVARELFRKPKQVYPDFDPALHVETRYQRYCRLRDEKVRRLHEDLVRGFDAELLG